MTGWIEIEQLIGAIETEKTHFLKDDVLVSLSTPGPTCHILLGAVCLLFVSVATYDPRKVLSFAILATLSALCQVLRMQFLLLWPWRW